MSIRVSGSFQNTERFLQTVSKLDISAILQSAGEAGVAALSRATPFASGETANAWSFEISINAGYSTITWTNSHVEDGANIALLLQYGHGTRRGGYVQGRDYINPAIQPIFDIITENTWKAVTSA